MGALATILGTFKSATGASIGGKLLTLQYSTDKSTWTSGETTTTASAGTFTLYSPSLTKARYLRVLFAGDADYPAATSSVLQVKPKVYFTNPPYFSTYTHTYGKTYTVWGYLKPKHITGSTWIKVKAYRKTKQSDGTYKYVWKKNFTTKISNPSGSSYSKYKGYVELPSKGKWRLRAHHAEDSNNASTYTGYRYVTVE